MPPFTDTRVTTSRCKWRNFYMKATGIVRRIDDLGRIVIPKEIRRTMRIREGDPMEIFTSREGEILLKKYSPVGELGEFASQITEAVAQTLGELVCITDRDYIIAAAGSGKKEFEGKLLDSELQTAIDNRCNQVTAENKTAFIKITPEDGKEYESQVVVTILSHGDCIGAVIILSKNKSRTQDELLLQLARTVASFLGKHMEQ